MHPDPENTTPAESLTGPPATESNVAPTVVVTSTAEGEAVTASTAPAPKASPLAAAITAPLFTLPQPGDNAFQAAWRNPYIRLSVFLLLIYLAFHFVGLVSHVITLFIIAYIIAYLAHPMLVWLERHRITRGLGVLVTLVIVIGMLIMTTSLLVTVFQQLTDLVQHLPEYAKSFSQWLSGYTGRFPMLSSVNSRLQEITQNGAAGLQQYVGPYLEKLVPYLRDNGGTLISTIMSFAGLLGEGFAVLIMSIYIMLDYDKIGLTMLRIFPRKWQPFVLDLSNNVGHAVGGYLKGQLVIAAFVGLVIGIGLAIAGIPSAPAIGFMAGAFNIVPYLGVVIAITPAILLAATAGGLTKVLIVIAIFVIANQVEGHFLSPLVLGRTTDLHPVTVIIAILTGLTLYGIVGALLAVPLAALGKLLLQEYYYSSCVYKEGP